MGKKEELIKKLYQTCNVMNCASKVARSYGTAHKLTYSDISLLQCVRNNAKAKASELSQYLGITNGAVTQLAKKLEEKGYLEPYRTQGNKKEVYYRLTPSGETACRGCGEHYGEMRSAVEAYIDEMDESTVEKMIKLFEVITDSAADLGNCSIGSKQTGQKEAVRKCEKCKTIY